MAGCSRAGCSREFRWSSFLLNHEDPRAFYRSPWLVNQRIFLAYRVTLAVVLVAILVWDFLDGPYNKWHIYYTNWGFTLLTCHAVWAAIVCVIGYRNERSTNDSESDQSSSSDDDDVRAPPELSHGYVEVPEVKSYDVNKKKDPLKWYHKVEWVLFNIAIPLAFYLTTAYCGFLSSGTFKVISVFEHIMNTVLATLDLFICGIPVRLLHIVHVFMFGWIYAGFTIVYWAAGGTNAEGQPYVYWFVDYSSHPGRAACFIAGSALVGTSAIYLFVYGLYRLRVAMVTCVTGVKARKVAAVRSISTDSTKPCITLEA
ncbi:protein rolling stone-like [Branchiostoma floridae x Branchiostoma belcheri]